MTTTFDDLKSQRHDRDVFVPELVTKLLTRRASDPQHIGEILPGVMYYIAQRGAEK